MYPLQNAVLVTSIDSPAACRDLKEGTYCPAVSLYTLPDQAEGATVTLNFGKCLRANQLTQYKAGFITMHACCVC